MIPRLILRISLLALIPFCSQAQEIYPTNEQPYLTRSERKRLKQEASVADGGYILLQGGLRKHEGAQGNDYFTGGPGEYNGLVSGLYGYRMANLSLEAGLGFIWHDSRNNYPMPGTNRQIGAFANFNSIYLPIGLRYDVPTGARKKFRFGANASMNVLLHQTRNPRDTSSGYFYYQFRPVPDFAEYDYKIEKNGVTAFFKMGLHAEVQVFKTSFFVFQVSKVLSPSPHRTVYYDWEYSGQSGSFVDEVKIDGAAFEMAYKLPLNLFSWND
ncbi:hypothetical protein [Algoriphagus namhaensis]